MTEPKVPHLSESGQVPRGEMPPEQREKARAYDRQRYRRLRQQALAGPAPDGATVVEDPDRPPHPDNPQVDVMGRFLPGNRMNTPGKTLTQFGIMRREIFARTKDGAELVEWVYRVWQGELQIEVGKDKWRYPGWDERRWAVEWLAERAWGKPSVIVDTPGPSVIIVQNGGDVE